MTTTRSTTPTMPRWPGPAPAEVPPGRQPRALQFGRLGPMAPVARIITDDGARIRFDGRGYATRRSQGDPSWRVAATLYFTTVDSRYSWLNGALAYGKASSTRPPVTPATRPSCNQPSLGLTSDASHGPARRSPAGGHVVPDARRGPSAPA